MVLGTTFSDHQCNWLGLDYIEACRQLCTFGFDVVRLCCYWNDIESQKGVFDFRTINNLLDICQSYNQHVILTVGMKAPRWPEYYLPSWLTNYSPSSAEVQFNTKVFLSTAITQLQHYSCITHWQIENEPLDPSYPNNSVISENFLREEAFLIKALDARPIVGTLWGNELKKRKKLSKLENLVDIVGVDIYYKVPTRKGSYAGPRDDDAQLATILHAVSKPVWIAELQAEPWENFPINDPAAILGSINASLIQENYDRAVTLSPEAILFWGYEYWCWKKLAGDDSLWQAAKTIVANKRSSARL